MLFKNLKVGMQVGLVFGAGLVLFIAVATITLTAMRGIHGATDQVSVATGAREAAADVLLQMVNQETGVRGYIATGDPHFLDIVTLSGLHVTADLPAIKAHQGEAGERERAAYANVQSAVERMSAYFSDQIALVKAGHRDQALARLNSERSDFEALRREVNELAAFAELKNEAASTAQDDAEAFLSQTLILATVIAIVVFGWMALSIGRRLGSRLHTVSTALDAIARYDVSNFAVALGIVADGDLTAEYTFDRQPITIDGRDEIAHLGSAYNQLVIAMNDLERAFGDTTSRLRSALRGVLATSRQLGGGSESMARETSSSADAIDRISRAFSEVAYGANDQAGRITNASSAAEELSRTAAQIASGAVEQANATRAAADAVYRLDEQIAALADLSERLAAATQAAIEQSSAGSQAVSRTSDALSALRAVNTDTVKAMTSLEHRTLAVSEILGTIDEIADQTNLLALNAAIEAARAGEHGRGFAVVAGEVRKLAERATGATREIAEILNAIRKETLLAMQALRSSTDRLEEGVAVANTGNDAINHISSAVRETASVAGEVRQRSGTMRNESGSITSHIASVSAIVEENAAAATEMQTTTHDLSTQLLPVAAAAEQQSVTAQSVSSSAAQLAEQMQSVLAFASNVRDGSEALQSLVNRFAVGDGVLAAAPGAPALTTN